MSRRIYLFETYTFSSSVDELVEGSLEHQQKVNAFLSQIERYDIAVVHQTDYVQDEEEYQFLYERIILDVPMVYTQIIDDLHKKIVTEEEEEE